MNQLEKRKRKRVGMWPSKASTPANLNLPEDFEVRIPPEQEIIDAIAKAVQDGKIKTDTPTKEDVEK